jgi:hypothetical protein
LWNGHTSMIGACARGLSVRGLAGRALMATLARWIPPM